MSTRGLIVAALICGLVILIAGTVMLVLVNQQVDPDQLPDELPTTTSIAEP